MALQTRDLWMITLGIQGDAPPNTLQPRLPDGMHLRWSFNPVKGFPWHGYYLYRRPSRGSDQRRICLSRYLSQFQTGTFGVGTISVPFGVLTSDEEFAFTDEFLASGLVEVNLTDRSYVRFEAPPDDPVYWVEATIGFRKTDDRPGDRICVDFRREGIQRLANPLVRSGARFTAFDHEGKARPFGRLTTISGNLGWDVSIRGRIDLPCPATNVQLLLAHGATAPKIVALDAAGKAVDSAGMSGTGPEILTLTGKGIVAVQIDAPQNECIVLRVCWTCPSEKGGNGGEARIAVDGFFGGGLVASAEAVGNPGDVVKVQLNAATMDRVDIGSGPAALIDLCVVQVRFGARGGSKWEVLKGFDYPLCLPVASGDYPCPGAPVTHNAAETMALNRIVYGPPGLWSGPRFGDLHALLKALVNGGPPPGGAPMHVRSIPVAGSPAPPPEVGGAITQQRQSPLELLMLGSLSPPIAQLLGLYWFDKTAVPGVHYDYLLVADHEGSLGGTAGSGLHWVNTVFDVTVNDAFIAFNRVVGLAAPLDAPEDVKAYSLPGATVAPDGGGDVIDATNNAGLIWDRKFVLGILSFDAPVMYHVWRAKLGNVEVPGSPSDDDFAAITKDSPLPVGTSITTPPQTPQHPGEWPPFGLNFIDRGRPDGWYAYRVSGIDIFGRHTPHSASAKWLQWSPRPAPRPWYYADPPGDTVINASRIRLLDKLPPPPPAGVEAFALDPDDPTVLHDIRWQDWRDSLSEVERQSVIGLRVRWRWDVMSQRQAPDAREFRIYYHPAPLNTLRGRVTDVIAAGASQSDVVTDIPNAQPANSFAGLSVRVGAKSFRVISSQAVSPLRFRVQNIGPTDNIRPASRTRCAVTLTPVHPLYEDFSGPQNWQDRMLTVGLGEHVTLNAGTRFYEVLLPVAGSPNRAGVPLATSLQEPMSAAVVGVTAVDDKQHSPDHRGDAARFGNESRIGGPATVFRVRREKPAAPEMPPDSDKVWASAADYHGNSYYTYRWLPATDLKTFVFRALDDAVFQTDLAMRPRAALQAGDLPAFPDQVQEPAWDLLKRQQVAAELNALNGVDASNKAAVNAAYGGLSNDGLRVLAALPGIEKVYVQLTHLPLDPNEPESGAPAGLRWRRVGRDVDPGALSAGQRAYVDTLDGKASNRYFYRCAYVDEVQNIGPLGLASPPVWLPDVTPPVAPRIAKVVAGDCQITLAWTSNREPDLAEYRVFRTTDRNAARDVRLMDLVHTVPVAMGDPAARPKTVAWVDAPVPGLRDLWYRLVAVDRVDPDPKGGGGNISSASPAMRARAFDQTPPASPPFTLVEWVRLDDSGAVHAWADPVPAGETRTPAVLLTWDAAAADVKLLVQLQGEFDERFSAASSWLVPGTTELIHRTDRTAETLTYRLIVVSGAGNTNVVFHPSILEPPA